MAVIAIREGLKNIEELKAQAERERKKFKTIIPAGLEKRVTVRYKAKTGNYLWAAAGNLQRYAFLEGKYNISIFRNL